MRGIFYALPLFFVVELDFLALLRAGAALAGGTSEGGRGSASTGGGLVFFVAVLAVPADFFAAFFAVSGSGDFIAAGLFPGGGSMISRAFSSGMNATGSTDSMTGTSGGAEVSRRATSRCACGCLRNAKRQAATETNAGQNGIQL